MLLRIRNLRAILFFTLAACLPGAGLNAVAASELTDPGRLEKQLQDLAASHPGRVGICIQDERSAPICVNGGQRFSLQSVMKVIVGAAVMDAADRGQLQLGELVTIRRDDLSVHIQPLAKIVARDGVFQTTVVDLVRRAVVESDSAATDVLIARLGGPSVVQTFLDRKGIGSRVRVDRDERHLQTEISGLTWKSDYLDPAQLEAARNALSMEERDKAFAAYLKDERDTATPHGMTTFLHALMTGRLLSESATTQLLMIMGQTKTFPDRLRAGVAPGWSVAHKTGTSHTWKGVTAVTNDVGILTAPDGGKIAVAAFVAASRGSAAERAAVIAAAARMVVQSYR